MQGSACSRGNNIHGTRATQPSTLDQAALVAPTTEVCATEELCREFQDMGFPILRQCCVHDKVGVSMLGVRTTSHDRARVRSTRRCLRDRVAHTTKAFCRDRDFSIATNLSSS